MKLVLFSSLLYLVVSSPVSPSCKIVDNVLQDQERNIEVECGEGVRFSVNLQDKNGVSTLDVTGQKASGQTTRFLTVTHHVTNEGTHEVPSMTLTLNGKQFDVKDASSAEEEAVALESLLENPDFSLFPVAARLIHDELKLPGWTSPSVMFLYRLAMSLSDHPQLSHSLTFFDTVDPALYDYHGEAPSKECKLNGESLPDVEAHIANSCIGTCGPKCNPCWEWVCGDCCVHTGCRRHDGFCRGSLGKFHKDCVSFRGVLWDTITDTPYDC